MFLCPYSNNKFDTLSGLVLSISKKYGFDKKVEFYISYYNLNIEELKKEYFEEEKGLKRISREKKVPYKVLKDVFLYYDINLRSPKEALILQNSKNKKIFLEKYGVENPFQLEEVKKKCNTEEVIEKRKKSQRKIFLEKYGVENPFQLEEVKKKCNTEEVIEKRKKSQKKYWENEDRRKSVSLRNKKIFLEKYGVENPFQLEEVKKKCNTEEVIEKSLKTKMEKGIATDWSKEDLNKFIVYQRMVRSETRKNYRIHKEEINPKNLKRGKGKEDYNLDHKVSIIDGFLNNVPYYVIASVYNLRIVKSAENYKKNRKSCIEVDFLMEMYNEGEKRKKS